jgi:hypothetical protein
MAISAFSEDCYQLLPGILRYKENAQLSAMESHFFLFLLVKKDR